MFFYLEYRLSQSPGIKAKQLGFVSASEFRRLLSVRRQVTNDHRLRVGLLGVNHGEFAARNRGGLPTAKPQLFAITTDAVGHEAHAKEQEAALARQVR